jgi:peptidoglycan hydrolase-like protein with peptidoglycan-binding domain
MGFHSTLLARSNLSEGDRRGRNEKKTILVQTNFPKRPTDWTASSAFLNANRAGLPATIAVLTISMTGMAAAQQVTSPPVRNQTVTVLLTEKEGGAVKQYSAKIWGKLSVDSSRRITGLDGSIQSLETPDKRSTPVTKAELRYGAVLMTTREGAVYQMYDMSSTLVGSIRLVMAAPVSAQVAPSVTPVIVASNKGGGQKSASVSPPQTTIGASNPSRTASSPLTFAASDKQAATKTATPSPLKVTVDNVAIGTTFQAYVGGGANISPPDTFGGGGGIPLISISDGAAFMAGEVSSKSETTKLLKITFTVANSADAATSFKIGDVSLAIAAVRVTDFAAVGYDSKLCAMSDTDRKKVKEIVVDVSPSGARTLSFAFPISATAKRGELMVGKSVRVPLEIAGNAEGQATAPPTSTVVAKKTIQGAQERLQALGYQSGPADGVMGPKAIGALNKFQSDRGLSATGALDSKTLEALNGSAASSDKKPTPSALSTNKDTASPPVAPASLVDKRYVTSESDIVFFLKDGGAAERNGHFGVLYARQSVAFDSNGQNPTTWCKYQQEQKKVTLTCDSEKAQFTINGDGSLTGPPEGMWGHAAFARLTELK